MIDALVQKLTTEGVKTETFFSSLSDEDWGRQLYADGAMWTVRQVFAHIVESEDALRRLFESIVQRGTGVHQDFDIDGYNKDAVDGMGAVPINTLFEMFQERRGKMVAFVSNLEEADLEKIGRHPFLGKEKLSKMIQLFYLHINIHMRDIKKALR